MKYTLLLALTFQACVAFSQAEFISKILPPSPDASSLGKYGDIPVGYYTGIPSIEVPLFTVEGNELSLPVSLSYHASGIKVEEIASWVGLGWSLNAGGVVTRSVRGLKDESAYGYTHLSDVDLAAIMTCTSTTNQSVVEGLIDAEPDVFYYNINGLTGKFFFDRQGNVILESPSFHKVIPTIVGEDITEWKIITDDGTTYLFKDIEVSKSRSTQPVTGPYEFSNSSWYITQMISPNKLDRIDFEYGAFTLNIDYSLSEQTFTARNPIGSICSSNAINYCLSYGPVRSTVANIIQGKRLKRIVSSKFDVEFLAGFQRQDISGNALSEIYIKRIYGDTLKSFVLGYDHFPSSRLKLKSVAEVGHFNAPVPLVNPGYKFTYNEGTNLPTRTSYAQDYWGFYNGAIQNPSLIPKVLYNNNGTYQDLTGGNRDTNEDASKANILTGIQFPTGGTTELEYEGHTYSWLHPDLMTDTLTQDVSASADAAPVLLLCESLGATVQDDETFTLFNNQVVKIYGTIASCEDAAGSLAPTIWIENQAGVTIKQFVINHSEGLTMNIDEYIPLTAGTYSIHSRTRFGATRASGGVHYKQFSGTTHIIKAGGVRIKRITSSPGYNMPPVVKEYFYNDSDTTSSGVLVSKPIYEHDQTNEKVGECSSVNGPASVYYNCAYYVRSSHTQMPLSTTSGSHIGYKNVVVKYSGNGMEEFKYTSALEYPDSGDYSFPFTAKTSNDWARGKLLQRGVYNESGSLVNQEVYKYSFKVLSYLPAYHVRRQNPSHPTTQIFQCKQYSQLITQVKLDSTRNEMYNGNSAFKTITSYTYDSIKGILPKIVTTISSKGAGLTQLFRYPFEYGNLTDLSIDERNALIRLDADNLKSTQIEVINKLGVTVKNKSRSDYSIISISNPDFPDVTSAVVLADRKSAIGNTTLLIDETFRSFNNQARPQEYESRTGPPSVILWNKKGQAIGLAELATQSQIAYAGFEESELINNWQFVLNLSNDAKTGLKSQAITGNSLIRNGLTASQKYIVSYWAKNGIPVLSGSTNYNDAPNADGDGWRYYEKLVTGVTSVTLSGTGTTLVDEVRLFPLGVKISTYTYDEGVGLTSKTDENSRTTRFKYDEFLRLKNVIDSEGNLLKNIDYHFKNQPWKKIVPEL